MGNNKLSDINKQVLFFQGGGGEEDYAADAKLVASLQNALGDTFVVHYPLLPNDSAPDLGRMAQINKVISLFRDQIILVGHSLGASMLLKYISENPVNINISGIFLIATPFWSGEEDWKQAFKLNKGFVDKIPKNIPIFLYHSQDDEEVPFEHLGLYVQLLPQAKSVKIPIGGHQLNNDLSLVAKDIKLLKLG